MENQEREISLKELFWKIVLAWKAWLICGVIFAVLFAGLRYVKDMRSYQVAIESLKSTKGNTAKDVAETVLTADECQEVQDAKSIQQAMDKSRKYLQESVLMNIDPYQEQSLILQYYIDSDYTWNINKDFSGDYTSAVTNAYAEYVKSGVVAKRIQEELGLDVEERYIEELISVEELESAVKTEDILTVQVIYNDEKVLEQMAQILKECLEEQTATINNTVGSHTLKLLSENIAVHTDSELAEKHSTVQSQMDSYRTQLNTLLDTMTEDQLAELDIVLAEEEEIVTGTLVKPSFSKKYLVLGFATGVIMVILWICGVAIFTSKLQSSQELETMYGLRLFGTMKKERKAVGLDKVLLSLKNRNQKQLSKKASFQFLISNLELACKAENVTQIFMTGTEIEHMEKAWLEEFVQKMEQAGIIVVYGENICYDAVDLRKASEIGCAILLEESGCSIYEEITKEVKILSEQNVKILGCIGVEV